MAAATAFWLLRLEDLSESLPNSVYSMCWTAAVYQPRSKNEMVPRWPSPFQNSCITG